MLGLLAHAGSIFDDDYVPPAPHQDFSSTPPPTPATVPSSISPAPDGPAPALPTEPHESENAPAVKLAVPPPHEQARSRKLFKELFASELKDHSATARLSLAAKLLSQADQVTDNPSDRFVLLVGACEASSEGGDLNLAERAADAASAIYNVDAAQLEADSVLKVTLKPSNSTGVAVTVDEVIAVVDLLIQARDISTAGRLLSSLQSMAARNPQAGRLVVERKKQLELLATEVRRVSQEADRAKRAGEKLKVDPIDPNANLVVGRFRCFVVDDWKIGLPALAAGSDAVLAALAKNELARPTTAEEQLHVADKWNEISVRESGFAKAHLRAHAEIWYSQSAAKSTGMAKSIAMKRLEEARDLDYADLFVTPTPEMVLSRRLNDLRRWTIKSGVWKSAGGKIRGEGDSRIDFNSPLPSDLVLTFHINVLSGMRPRLYFQGTNMMYGNEGFRHTFTAFGVNVTTGGDTLYENGQNHLFRFLFKGGSYEVQIDGKLASAGTCTGREPIRLEFHSGDGFSPGAIELWDFRVERPPAD